jgi:hypothetical protein
MFFSSEYTRRDWLRLSLGSALGVSCSGWLPRLAQAADGKPPKACILLWMSGGPSQTDTFDLKVKHANGGPSKEIQTAVPGIRISEHLPGVARQMNDVAIIRSMTTREGDHGRGTDLMLTGFRPGTGGVQYPTLGSLVSKEIGPADNELPNFVSISEFRFSPNAASPGYLGPHYAPLVVSGNSDAPQARANLSIENLRPPTGVGKDSMQSRFELLKFLQNDFAERTESASAKSHQANYDRALRMVQSQAKHAFELDKESAELRDRYGRTRFGQGCLLARRLVERGVPFVEVTLSGTQANPVSWDTHGDNFNAVRGLCETLDPAWSTLMDDLRERGMLEDTMIVWMGEFGRTPQINQNTGRDHFPTAWSTVLAGGGIKGGQVIGDTGIDGMQVVDRPVTAPDLMATICQGMGIHPGKDNYTSEGRPIRIIDEGGGPIKELVG